MPLADLWRGASSLAVRFLRQHALRARFLVDKGLGGPLVTVVVPVYNGAPWLHECLRSVRRQSYRHLECIIVDDASTDDSQAIAKALETQDPRFRLVAHAENLGPGAARNTGLLRATGQLITFLDADDFLFPHALWWRVDALARKDADDVAGAYCEMATTPEKPSAWRRLLWAHRPTRSDRIDFLTCRDECPFRVHAPLVKAELLRRFGGFNAAMRHRAEDWDLWLRLLRHGYTFVPAPAFGGAYRQRPGSIVRRMPDQHLDEAVQLIEKVHRPLPESAVVAGTPYVYRRPLAYYEEVLARTKRVVQFAVLAHLAGDREGLDKILARLEPGSGFFVRAHIDLGMELDAGCRRFHATNRIPRSAWNAGWAQTKAGLLRRILERVASPAERKEE